MKVSVQYRKAGWTVIHLNGVEAPNAPPDTLLEDHLLACAGEVHGLILDMQNLEFIDSTIMGILFSVQKKLHAKGMDMLLAGPAPSVLTVLRIVHLDEVFGIYPDVPSAIAGRNAG